MKKAISLLLLSVLLTGLLSCVSFAADSLVIEDGADLLTDAEEAELIEKYSEITEYLPAAVVTTDRSAGTTADFAEAYAIRRYGNDPAVIFIIDMDDREIYVYANDAAQKTFSKADARAITDNIYQYASNGDYAGCVDRALYQILAKCQGKRLARPVKHITNLLIAVLAGVIINYLVVVVSRMPRMGRRTIGSLRVSVSRRMATMPGISLAAPILIKTVKRYKNNDSGGGGGSFGGGGGGGGHSGGGGGHSF